jgi:hypothetical protein
LKKAGFIISLTLVILAAFFSSLTLWLLNSWIKYPLFIFEVFAIIVVYLIVSNYDIKLNTSRNLDNFHAEAISAILLIVLPVGLLLLNILNVQIGAIQLVMVLLVTSILPGYALLRLLNLTCDFSRLELFVLSYVMSLLFTGLITLTFLFVNGTLRLDCIIGGYIVLALISMLKPSKTESLKNPHPSFTKNIDFIAIIVAIVFFALSFYLIYPGFALLPGTDISRDYAVGVQLWKAPNLYIGSTEILFNLHESLFITLSNQPLLPVQLALLMLNFMLPLAFYILAKAYLEKIDPRLPSLATLFWVLFTNGFGGFSWLYLSYLKVSSPNLNQLQLLTTTADKTLNGTIYGIFGLWYISATVAFVVLMTAIFLLTRKEISTYKFVILFSVITATLYLTHVVEAMVFCAFLALYGLVSRNVNLKIDASLKGSLIGFGLSAFVYYVLSKLSSHFIFDTMYLIALVLPIFLLTTSIVIRHFAFKIPFSSLKLRQKLSIIYRPKLFVGIILFAFITGLLAWFSFVGSFSTTQVDSSGVVPWFIYPLILGITGLLSMVTLYYVTTNPKSTYRSLRFWIAFLIFVFIMGTLVSLSNLYLFNVDYWEKRFVWFMKISLALLSPIPVLLFVDGLKKRVSVNMKKALSIILVGTICMYGVSTTFLNIEYWNVTSTNSANYPSSLELTAIDSYKKILDNDPLAWSATVTSTSSSVSQFAAPDDTLLLRQLLYNVNTPEMVLTQLYRNPIYSHPYIYLDTRDDVYLSGYSDQFLSKYLLPTLPTAYSNSEVTIYNVSSLSYPQPSSGNVLLIPFDNSVADEQSSLLAYYALSYGYYSYTTAYDTDHNALNFNQTILSFDPPQEDSINSVFEDHFNQTLDSWAVQSGTWNLGSGQLLGGNGLQSDEGVILSSETAENFSATVGVTPLSGNSTLANYVRFVYSFTDPNNYRIADVLFNNDGYIYLVFRDFVNGVETDSPQWPGMKTSLKWTYNTEYPVKLTVNGLLNQLSIGNSTLSISTSETTSGKIGLGYYRFSSVAFDDFSINYSTALDSRPVNDYLNYLNSGGKLIVINTNGNQFFYDNLFSVSNTTIPVQKIVANNTEISLPYELSVPQLTIKDCNTTIVSEYQGSDNETPFIVQKNYANGGELTYVNAYPIVNAMLSSDNESAFYPLLGHLLDGINIGKLPATTPIPNLNGYVRQIFLSNSTEIQTTSILFPSQLSLNEVDAKSGNQLLSFYNVTSMTINGYSNVNIASDNAVITDGNGFYAKVNFNSTFSINPSANTLNLTITTEGQTFNLNNIDMLSMIPSSGGQQIQVRTPTVSANEVNFTELYLQNYKQLTMQIYGQNLNVDGFTTFSVVISDTYQAIGDLTLGPSLQISSQTPSFNVLSTLPTALFWFILLMPVFVAAYLIFTFKKQGKLID